MVIQLILIQVLTFIVIVVVFYLLSGRHLRGALTRLQALHQENLEKEEVLSKELDRAKALAQSEIARGREEAKQIVEGARREHEKIGREAAEKAEAAARKLLQEAQVRAKRMEAEILGSVEERSRMLAAEVIRSVFTAEDNKLLHSQLVRELVEEMKKIERGRLGAAGGRAQVLTPVALAAGDRHMLEEVFSSRIGTPVTLEEILDPDLILGVIVKFGSLVIDASLKNKLGKAMAALTHIKIA